MPVLASVEVATIDGADQLVCVAVTTATGTNVYECGVGNPLDVSAATKAIDELAGAETVVSFNGGSFALRLLWALTDDGRLKEMAKHHFDIFVDFVSKHRYMGSLNSFSSPTLNTPSLESCVGIDEKWSAEEGRESVISACTARAEAIHMLYAHAARYRKLSRRAKSGRVSEWVVDTDGPTPFRTLDVASMNPSRPPAWLARSADIPDVSWCQ